MSPRQRWLGIRSAKEPGGGGGTSSLYYECCIVWFQGHLSGAARLPRICSTCRKVPPARVHAPHAPLGYRGASASGQPCMPSTAWLQPPPAACQPSPLPTVPRCRQPTGRVGPPRLLPFPGGAGPQRHAANRWVGGMTGGSSVSQLMSRGGLVSRRAVGQNDRQLAGGWARASAAAQGDGRAGLASRDLGGAPIGPSSHWRYRPATAAPSVHACSCSCSAIASALSPGPLQAPSPLRGATEAFLGWTPCECSAPCLSLRRVRHHRVAALQAFEALCGLLRGGAPGLMRGTGPASHALSRSCLPASRTQPAAAERPARGGAPRVGWPGVSRTTGAAAGQPSGGGALECCLQLGVLLWGFAAAGDDWRAGTPHACAAPTGCPAAPRSYPLPPHRPAAVRPCARRSPLQHLHRSRHLMRPAAPHAAGGAPVPGGSRRSRRTGSRGSRRRRRSSRTHAGRRRRRRR